MDTKEYFTSALLTEFPLAYSRRYSPACQPLMAAQPPIPRRAATLWRWRNSCRCSASSMTTGQLGYKCKLGEKPGKTNNCFSVHGIGQTLKTANACWFKGPADFKVTSWQQVLIFGPFKQSSDDDTNINSLGDLPAIFQYCKESLTQTRDTASGNQRKAFAEYSQIAKGIDLWQGWWDTRNASSLCSHTLWHSWEERKPQKAKAICKNCYLQLTPRAKQPVTALFYRSTGLPRLANWFLEEEVQRHL